MKSLLLHCKNYRVVIEELANRPNGIHPEVVTEHEQTERDCIVALVTVEKGDTVKSTEKLVDEIEKMSQEVGHNRVVILPFAHLSHNLADSETSIPILDNLKAELSEELEVKRSHFGSHKDLLLDLYGHPGNARFREF